MVGLPENLGDFADGALERERERERETERQRDCVQVMGAQGC